MPLFVCLCISSVSMADVHQVLCSLSCSEALMAAKLLHSASSQITSPCGLNTFTDTLEIEVVCVQAGMQRTLGNLQSAAIKKYHQNKMPSFTPLSTSLIRFLKWKRSGLIVGQTTVMSGKAELLFRLRSSCVVTSFNLQLNSDVKKKKTSF